MVKLKLSRDNRKVYININIDICMETTIAVKERTAQMLMRLKRIMDARNVDVVINKLLEESGKIEKSRFGSNKKLREFSEKDRGDFREL